MPGPRSRYEWTTASAALILVLLFMQANALAAADRSSNSGQPDLSTIVARVTLAQIENHARVKPYSVDREYKIFGSEDEVPRTDVLAKISFLPPDQKSYDIDRSTGGLGEKIVRHILDHEVRAARATDELMITPQNYEFSYLGEEDFHGQPCYKLAITPRHDGKEMLKATVWVETGTYRILHVEGEPAKSPSFWVKDIHLELGFKEVGGMWLQTSTHATARTRFGGEYRMVSSDLNYDLTDVVAAKHKAPHSNHKEPAILASSVGEIQ